jgi:hypothetical protein
VRAAATLVVLGMMGRMPVAGVTWQFLQYLEGFRRLGFATYYVEDTDAWPYDPDRNTISDDPSYAVRMIGSLMREYGFADRWAYRAVDGRVYGLAADELDRVLARADALVNVTGSTVLREEHRRVPVRIYLETDPVLPQIELAKGQPYYRAILEAHTHHFTYAENIGQPDCGVPVTARFPYRPTRPPIVLEWWTEPGVAPGPAFTTVASWRQAGKDVEWRGETYTWSKHYEFLKIIDLPRRTTQPLELALAIRGQPAPGGGWVPRDREDADAIDLLTAHGWRVANAMLLSREIAPYRDYIRASRGELTVAKDQNVRLRSGWFSDRSACYLAAGRPVITQDTAFGKFVPTGAGLFAFRGMEDALAALEAVNADYAGHAKAARETAAGYFRAETVLARLVEECGLA